MDGQNTQVESTAAKHAEALAKLRRQHSHRTPDHAAQNALKELRRRTLDLAVWLDAQVEPGREKALAQTALDECRMWACNALTMNGEIKEELLPVSAGPG